MNSTETIMTKEEYLEFIETQPEITYEGFGVNMAYADGKTRKELFAQRRQELKDAYPNFLLCLEWLVGHEIHGRWNAHYWKDQVQNAYKPEHPGYFHIGRGVFILAALYKGYDVTEMDDSTDAWISVSE